MVSAYVKECYALVNVAYCKLPPCCGSAPNLVLNSFQFGCAPLFPAFETWHQAFPLPRAFSLSFSEADKSFPSHGSHPWQFFLQSHLHHYRQTVEHMYLSVWHILACITPTSIFLNTFHNESNGKGFEASSFPLSVSKFPLLITVFFLF